MSLINKDKIYFHGLDELRAIAALLVFMHHVEQFKAYGNLPSLFGSQHFKLFSMKIGHNAVIAFFVLSGFLITYLLLIEKQKTSTINIRAFYFRRIYRIWPLYFLSILIGYLVVPLLDKTGLFETSIYYTKLIQKIDFLSLPLAIIFLSNFSLKFFSPIVGASQNWSVSLEEQFYLIWPHLIKRVKTPKFAFVLIICAIAIKLLFQWSIGVFYKNSLVYNLLEAFSIEYMFVGSLTAIVFFKIEKRENIIRYFRLKTGLFIIIGLILVELFRYSHSVLISLLISMLIIQFITQKIEIPLLKPLGKISYGLYMFHPFVLYLTFPIVANIKSTFGLNVLFYGISLLFTILISWLSYVYFEKPILKFKKKHTIIESGSN